MKGKVAFVVGAAVGYVIGTAAGRQKYEKMKAKASDLWRSDQVQDTVDDLQHKATDFAKTQGSAIAEKVGEGVEKVTGTVKDKVSSSRTTETEDDLDSALSADLDSDVEREVGGVRTTPPRPTI